MRAGHRLSLILAFATLPAWQAGAQTLPWPTNGPRAGAPAAVPGMVAAPGPTAAAAPVPGGFGPPPGAAPPGAGFGGAPPACLGEFTKLRDDVQKKGAAAKALSERKPTREEMCKQVTVYAAAEAKWVKYTEANVANCGIPPQIVQELKTVHTHTEQTRERICAPAVAAAPPAPSLSDALGTARLPTPETTKTGGGTLDTLTGNVISR
jgi:hypothetical protein